MVRRAHRGRLLFIGDVTVTGEIVSLDATTKVFDGVENMPAERPTSRHAEDDDEAANTAGGGSTSSDEATVVDAGNAWTCPGGLSKWQDDSIVGSRQDGKCTSFSAQLPLRLTANEGENLEDTPMSQRNSSVVSKYFMLSTNVIVFERLTRAARLGTSPAAATAQRCGEDASSPLSLHSFRKRLSGEGMFLATGIGETTLLRSPLTGDEKAALSK
jgi:hypothetical protein